MNDRFAMKQVPVSIRVGSSVATLQVLITRVVSGVETVAYTRLVEIKDTTKHWKSRIELESGDYKIEVIGRDNNGGRVGELGTPVTFRCLDGDPHDVRSTFEASFYLGYGIDSFAASELRKYLNPEAAGEVVERIVGGFDFGYRLFGDPMNREGHQLWVYGETLHGVRSADVDCTANPGQPLCKDLLAVPNPNPGEQLSAILRKATSLEAFAGLRWEFRGINFGSDAARAYFKTQFGFVTVAGLGGDVVDLHQYAAFGLTATKGKLRNSYMELGYGKSDFFLDNRKKRWKIDGFLSIGSRATEGLAALMRPFAQITVDSDFGKGSDSVQTYIGIDFDVSVLWRGTP